MLSTSSLMPRGLRKDTRTHILPPPPSYLNVAIGIYLGEVREYTAPTNFGMSNTDDSWWEPLIPAIKEPYSPEGQKRLQSL